MAPHPAIFGAMIHGERFALSPSLHTYSLTAAVRRRNRMSNAECSYLFTSQYHHPLKSLHRAQILWPGARVLACFLTEIRAIRVIRGSLVFAPFVPQFSRHADRELQGRLRALCGEIPSSRCSSKKITWRTLDKCGNRNQLRFCTNLADPISNLAEPAKTAAIFPLLKIRVYPCDPRFSWLRPGLVATAARAGSSVDVSEE